MDTIHVTADAEALCRRATQFIDTGRLEAARPLLAAARALAPPSPELTLIGARLHLGSGTWDRGLA